MGPYTLFLSYLISPSSHLPSQISLILAFFAPAPSLTLFLWKGISSFNSENCIHLYNEVIIILLLLDSRNHIKMN